MADRTLRPAPAASRGGLADRSTVGRSRRITRPGEQRDRVRLACDAMVAEGGRITAAAVAARAGVGRNVIFAHPDLHEVFVEARLRAAKRDAELDAGWAPEVVVMPETAPAAGEGEPSVAGLVEKWISGRVARGEVGRRSGEVDAGRLAGLVACCGHMAPGSLDGNVLARWQASIGSLSASTRRHYIGAVRRFCGWLVVEGHIAADPSTGMRRPREPRRVPRALSASEVARVLETAGGDPLWLAVVWLMAGMGLRCVEVSRLDVDDWDRDARTLLVHGKGGHERVLPVPEPVRAALSAYVEVRGWRAGPLFRATGSKGQPDGRLSARWISKRVAKLMARAGVHQQGDGRSAHSLRHTAASDVFKQCRDIRLVQGMLGHASLQTTQVYLRVADLSAMREAMEGRDYAAGAGA